MADLRPDLASIFGAFETSAAATVTPVGGAPVSTTVIVGGNEIDQSRGDFAYPHRLKRISLRRAVVPSLVSGSTIVIAGITYIVDETEHVDDEILRVLAH